MRIKAVIPRAAAWLCLAILWTDCSFADGAGPVSPPASGTFQLATINGKALPDTVLELPSRSGGPSGCFAVATRGWLVLDGAKHFFLIARHLESNCGTGFGSDTTAYGGYRPRGDSLRLMVFNGTDSLQFAAASTRTQITVDDPTVQWRYVFDR